MGEVHDILYKEGGTFNGVRFNSIAEVFASLGTKIVCGSSINNKSYSFYRKLSNSEKKSSRAKNKAERQRRKKGRS